MRSGKFTGTFVIGDNSYLEELVAKDNPTMKKLIFSGKLNAMVDVETVDAGESDYPVAVANIHFYNGEKQMSFDMIKETLHYDEGLKITDKQLGCDTASFEIYGKNHVTINTLSDGYYGNVFQSLTGETIITVYVTHDSMNANELEEKIVFALGL